MELIQDNPAGHNLIKSYRDGCVEINNQSYEHSIILSPKRIISPWQVRHVGDLTEKDCTTILELNPEIVIIGTGKHLHFLPPTFSVIFHSRRIGCEVMDTAAACRTYSILAADGREVIAALMI